MLYVYFQICFILTFLSSYTCFEAISTGIGIASSLIVSVGIAGYSVLKCKFEECCDDSWINFNFNAFEKTLEDNLFGQHLVKRVIPLSLRGHAINKDPKKALVLSFHGSTGSGKNYVSKMVAENLYKKGMKSEFVHLYIGTQHFPHKEEVSKYRDKLRNEIAKATRTCGRSLFIFDEVDKMSPGVLEAVAPYIDFHHKVDDVDYRKNIFLFLSNAGGGNITQVTLNFWIDGRDREDIEMSDLEPLISRGAYNERGGFQYSGLVKRDLIDVYVPFLPLERKHVKKCISTEMLLRRLSHDEDKLNRVANQLIYYPPEVELFSISGCKKVSQKIDVFGMD